eukprot:3688537-Rhodomonas_salina.1
MSLPDKLSIPQSMPVPDTLCQYRSWRRRGVGLTGHVIGHGLGREGVRGHAAAPKIAHISGYNNSAASIGSVCYFNRVKGDRKSNKEGRIDMNGGRTSMTETVPACIEAVSP